MGNPKNYYNVSKNWEEFSKNRRIYDQIRFISCDGFERIRVNFDGVQTYIVPNEKLQNKKDRYYFYETTKLNEGSIYVSKIDLNIENGSIEKPFKPMIRFVTPVYDENGNKIGVIVLNYLADNLIQKFRELAKNSTGNIKLLNEEGYSFSSEEPENDWNFMFEGKRNNSFANNYPKEWSIINSENGRLVSKNGIFTFKSFELINRLDHILPNTPSKTLYTTNGTWKIVSVVNKNDDNSFYVLENYFSLAIFVFKKNCICFIFLMAISLIMGMLVRMNKKTYENIKYYSEYDGLTDIYNRRAGIDRLNKIFAEKKSDLFRLSLCFIDINGLKEVNDILGHIYGDELIVTVAQILKSQIRNQDFVMRLGGDEFLVVFFGIEDFAAEDLWETILESYNEINDTENRPYIISVSHGIVDYTNKDSINMDDLISCADDKMYREKEILKKNLTVIRSKIY